MEIFSLCVLHNETVYVQYQGLSLAPTIGKQTPPFSTKNFHRRLMYSQCPLEALECTWRNHGIKGPDGL